MKGGSEREKERQKRERKRENQAEDRRIKGTEREQEKLSLEKSESFQGT